MQRAFVLLGCEIHEALTPSRAHQEEDRDRAFDVETAVKYRKETLKAEIEALAGDDAIIDGKIRAFLLHPRAAALYEIRLKQLKEATAGKPVDLSQISPADNCKNGGCAIKDK